MVPLLTVFGLGTVLSLVLTPLARTIARRHGLLDRPDGRRKMHAAAIPVAGGIAVFLSASLAVAGAFFLSPLLRQELGGKGYGLVGLFLAAFVICVFGFADDLGRLRGRHKVLGQLLAVGILLQAGVVVRSVNLLGGQVELGLLAIPFTAFWLLGAINSLNLLDGMDGLLSSVGLILSLALALMAALNDQLLAGCVAIALTGALAGFLRYNFPPASIFLGDAGSMLVGLVVGTLAIQTSMKGPTTVALAAPIALFTIPILDTLAAIIRRKLTGRSIYTTDRAHLHHCLLRRGFSHRSVLLFVSLFCILAAAGSLASAVLRSEVLAIFVVMMVAAILISTQLFGYAEFMLVKKRLGSALLSFWRFPHQNGARQIEVHIQGSADWKALWEAIQNRADDLNLRIVQLDVNAPAIYEGYHARWESKQEDSEVPSLWLAEIPLALRGQVLGRLLVSGQRDDEPVWLKIATVARLVEDFERGALRLVAESRASATDEKNSSPFPREKGTPHQSSRPEELSVPS
jgi:UDP-GlcNAc:undecaprenyl-phosphate/decaprenyl-phosphate GlcNAc-1-phosphate transferase